MKRKCAVHTARTVLTVHTVHTIRSVQYVPSLTDLGINPLGEISEHREAVIVTSLSAVCALLLRTAKDRSPAGE